MVDLPLTLKEAGAALRAGALTSSQITAEMLRRTKILNPQLSAFLAITEESALAESSAADEKFAAGVDLGPLQGIPWCTKDLIATKDAPTTGNSHVLDRRWGAGWDAPVVARMRAAGAVHMGKTTLSEFACGLPDVSKGWPMPRNPWDPHRSPAGSSRGTGIAVSSGMVYCGLGTDTGGSVRAPAAVNGHSSIKATFGRVPKSGCVPLAYSLDHIGPHARSAWDCAAVLNVIAGYDATDRFAAEEPVEDFTAGLDGDLSGIRIGLPMNYWFEVATDEVKAAVFAAVDKLRTAGASVTEIRIEHAEKAQIAGLVILLSEAFAYHLKDLQTRPNDYGFSTRIILSSGAFYSSSDYIQAQRFRTWFIREMAKSMNDLDVLIVPGWAAPAGLLSDSSPEDTAATAEGLFAAPLLTAPFNITGQPAMVVPCGFSRDTHMPLSLQVVGKPFAESAVIKVADAYQGLTSWHLEVPPLVAALG